ncbi:hypothetical protein BDP27DRAFT_1432859 [Rhodocollybia butyracea]|uniref:Uncharacterized protein n=1 Tax=Rhodocollybia butyracea TaxID=206335 RepID=A0A9P5P802_9AGAR|nr:hypothetical protein BDP27DRAFT_1432859 [Rhodocollybia butyracea]
MAADTVEVLLIANGLGKYKLLAEFLKVGQNEAAYWGSSEEDMQAVINENNADTDDVEDVTRKNANSLRTRRAIEDSEGCTTGRKRKCAEIFPKKPKQSKSQEGDKGSEGGATGTGKCKRSSKKDAEGNEVLSEDLPPDAGPSHATSPPDQVNRSSSQYLSPSTSTLSPSLPSPDSVSQKIRLKLLHPPSSSGAQMSAPVAPSVQNPQTTHEQKETIHNLKFNRGMEFAFDTSLIVNLCCTLVIWLNLTAGVSRNTANIILKVLQLILSTTFNIVEVALTSNLGVNAKLPAVHIPQDIRTAYHICGNIGTLPWRCGWKESPGARVCGAELWRRQRFGHRSKWVPKTLYNTQNFESWLHFFLSRKTTEAYLESAFLHTPAAFGAEMHDCQDSPAWKDLHNYLSNRYHLVFSLYIDWFNPYTNKIAGIIYFTLYAMNNLTLPYYRQGSLMWSYYLILPESPSRNPVLG